MWQIVSWKVAFTQHWFHPSSLPLFITKTLSSLARFFIPLFFHPPPFFPYGSRCLMRTKRAHSKLAPDSTMLKLFIHDSTPSRVVIKFLLTFYRILDRTFSLCSKLSISLHLLAEISFSRWQIYVLCRTVSISLFVRFTFLLFEFLYTWNCRSFSLQHWTCQVSTLTILLRLYIDVLIFVCEDIPCLNLLVVATEGSVSIIFLNLY